MFPTIENRTSDFTIFRFHRMHFPDHLHAQIEISLPLHGDYHARVDGKDYHLLPGQALTVFPNLLHSYPDTNCGDGVMLIFSPALLPDMGVDWENTAPLSPVVRTLNEDARYAAQRLMQLSPAAALTREINALLHLLLCGLLADMTLESAPSPQVSDILYRALRYIAEHYASPDISLKAVAHHVGVNEYHLSHLFNARVHTDFRRYISLLRMDDARRLLAQKSLSIEEIACRCGFLTLRSFDRVFKSIERCTPREYRRSALIAQQRPPHSS